MDEELQEIVKLLSTINDKLYRIAKKMKCYE